MAICLQTYVFQQNLACVEISFQMINLGYFNFFLPEYYLTSF